MKVRPFNKNDQYYYTAKVLIENWFLDNLDMGFETTEEIVAEELEKQRRKLRDMTASLEQQHQMLRLIVQVSF